ncbi:cytochrome c-type biogenesis protein [Bordetella petrii]|uniref:cytochrome c-type biogenesis protein n=1 Tax=Bordetella petrii TaxID=94624 RepID=UPI001E2E4CAD|nr:cytochrome c-type biogenesis protein [Bordetella petrii]MCD0501410.1 cytochrome c-type biogenesis protein CcmH [Bordetella petrii]
MKRVLAAALLWALLGSGLAAIDTFEFSDDAQRARYRHLAETLRCPKCQNQNIADSNSPIANDLRNEVHRLLDAGHTDQQIIEFMVARYGEFVLYQPPLNNRTLLLWYGPPLLLLAGAAVLAGIILRRRRAGQASGPLSASEQQRLSRLLEGTPRREDAS